MELGTPVLKRINKRTIDVDTISPHSKIERLSMQNLNSELAKRSSRKNSPYDFLIINSAQNLKKDTGGSKSKLTPSRVKGHAIPISIMTTNRIDNKANINEGNQSFYLNMLEKYQVLNQSKTPKGLKSLFPALETIDDAIKIKFDGVLSPNIKPKIEGKHSVYLRDASKVIGKPEYVTEIDEKSKSPSKLKSDRLVQINEENSQKKGSQLDLDAEKSIAVKSNEVIYIQKSQSQEFSKSHKSKNKKSHQKKGFGFLCCF